MDKEDIVKYVMHTPANTNPAVLRSMLGSVEGGGDGGGTEKIIDIGYSGGHRALQATYNQIVAWVRAGDTLIAKRTTENAYEPEAGITKTEVIEEFSLLAQYYTSTLTTMPTPGKDDGTIYNVDFAGVVYTSNDPDTFMIDEGGD